MDRDKLEVVDWGRRAGEVPATSETAKRRFARAHEVAKRT